MDQSAHYKQHAWNHGYMGALQALVAVNAWIHPAFPAGELLLQFLLFIVLSLMAFSAMIGEIILYRLYKKIELKNKERKNNGR